MSEEQFLRRHQILCRQVNGITQWVVINLLSLEERRYNIDRGGIDPVEFEFWTGRSLDEEEINEISTQIIHDYAITYDDEQ